MTIPNQEAALQRAASLIRKSLTRRPSLPELAAASGFSPFHFHRRFRAHFSETPGQMSTRLRVEYAKELMRRGVPLVEVARRCGFSNQSHLSARFKARTGMQPTRWLKD